MSDSSRREFLARGLSAAALTAGAGLVSRSRLAGASTEAQTTDIGISQPDVIVIGAGLSGLSAALLLEELGASVQVLEGRSRVGGRLYTLDDVPGHPEAGGSGIGSSYGRVLSAMDRFKVERGPERPRTVPVREISMLNIERQNILLPDWLGHSLNPLPEAYRDMMPWLVQYGLYAKNNPLSSPSQFLDPQYAKFDVSVYEFLRQQGLDHRSIMLCAGTNMSYGDEAGPHGLSVLMWFNILAFANANRGQQLPGSPFAGKGGNQRIPEAMAAGLRNHIAFNAAVVGIRSNADGAEVRLADGTRLTAGRVIVTTPFSALRLIDLDAPVSAAQANAIRSLGYTNVTQLHYVPKRKFWEDDGMPPSIWSDGPTARFMALRNNPDDPAEITSFIAFANDRVAEHLDRLGPEGANAHVLSYLESIRPSTKGALEFVKFWSWQLDPFAGGAYAAWRPGQLSSFGAAMAEPAGRVHFAGEHTAQAARGMEGAMESGERAAIEVLEVL